MLITGVNFELIEFGWETLHCLETGVSHYNYSRLTRYCLSFFNNNLDCVFHVCILLRTHVQGDTKKTFIKKLNNDQDFR